MKSSHYWCCCFSIWWSLVSSLLEHMLTFISKSFNVYLAENPSLCKRRNSFWCLALDMVHFYLHTDHMWTSLSLHANAMDIISSSHQNICCILHQSRLEMYLIVIFLWWLKKNSYPSNISNLPYVQHNFEQKLCNCRVLDQSINCKILSNMYLEWWSVIE